MVWQADWTDEVTPGYYVDLADIFLPAAIPQIYGAATQVVFSSTDLAQMRQNIINCWRVCALHSYVLHS
jgi:hypothetical protein